MLAGFANNEIVVIFSDHLGLLFQSKQPKDNNKTELSKIFSKS